MKGSKAIIEALNSVLTKELTAINQYFLHARMLQDWGLEKLGKLEYEASIDEMKLRIGQDVGEVIDADLEVEYEAVPHLKKCIQMAEAEHDYATRDLFLSILKSEEHHIDWLETQRDLLKAVGKQNYIQSQMEPDKGAE
jgi:bacterioferritin